MYAHAFAYIDFVFTILSVTAGPPEMNNKLIDVLLTKEEKELFATICKIIKDENTGTTVRVAGMSAAYHMVLKLHIRDRNLRDIN